LQRPVPAQHLEAALPGLLDQLADGGFVEYVGGKARALLDDRALLQVLPLLADGVVQEQVGPPGAEDPATIVLRQRHGLVRARQVSTAEAALVGACDGTLSVEAIVRALAEILDDDVAELRDDRCRCCASWWSRATCDCEAPGAT